MKKIVFALIAVLLLGTFVACDGEADFLLWEDEPVATKTLTLKFSDGSGSEPYSFDSSDSSVDEKGFSVPDSVTTWQDLIDEFEITAYYVVASYSAPYNLICCETGSFIWFVDDDSSQYIDVYCNDQLVRSNDLIDFNAVYTLDVGWH